MLKRFVYASLAFVGLILPATFVLALLMAPATPATPLEKPGCERELAIVKTSIANMQAEVKRVEAAHRPDLCTATRLYFLELVKARAVTAVCRIGPGRDRELDRLDADVAHTNEAIAAHCR